MTHQPRRQFLKTAGSGALAVAALSTHLHAAQKRRPPWAYTGTDNDSGISPYPLTPNNSLPALVVWLTMAVSTDLQNNMTDGQLQQLADTVGLTKNSVASIRNLMTTGTATVSGHDVNVGEAFAAVAQVFLQIGKPRGSGPYDPGACPGIVDILSFGPAAIARDPKP